MQEFEEVHVLGMLCRDSSFSFHAFADPCMSTIVYMGDLLIGTKINMHNTSFSVKKKRRKKKKKVVVA